MGIYSIVKKNWKVYCLMSAIAYIEEMSKPTEHIQIKKHKDKTYRCLCFHSIRLKMNNPEFIRKFFMITKIWEKKKGIKLIGESFNTPKKEKDSGQDFFYLNPLWLNLILVECGKIPNKYSFNTAKKRIVAFKKYPKIAIDETKSYFDILLKNKLLAAGAFILSMDLECRGVNGGRPCLCMSEKFKDFLEFMLKVAKKYKWTNNKELSSVSVEYSKNLGIKASPQFEFKINIKGLKEIYKLAGPLANSHKDKCVKFNVNRSEKYINLGGGNKKNNTSNKILQLLSQNKNMTTTLLQFEAKVGTDVVLDHLNKLEKNGKVIKQRNGKRYIWNIK